MSEREELCITCRSRIRKRYPCGKTIYVGKREPLDHQRLSQLLKKKIPAEKLAVEFGVTVRRIQQIAASQNVRGDSHERTR